MRVFLNDEYTLHLSTTFDTNKQYTVSHTLNESINLRKTARLLQVQSITLKTKARQSYPDFINKSLDNYYQTRLAQSWKGEHILGASLPDKHSILFQSNDYLCLSKHPKLIKAQQQAMADYGNGSMQSSVFQNHDPMLLHCESTFANWLQYPDCLLAQSGWCANTGLLQSIATRGLPVYIDFYAHMSLWEGIHAARAKSIPFQHNNMQSLEKRLQRFGSGIIVVDSIYSTTGTIAPLEEICALAKAYRCITVVDESHALGIFGAQGRGMVAKKNLTGQVDLITASLAKTIAGRGGLIAGPKSIIEMIRYNSYPTIFSTSLLPHDLAGFLCSLKLIKEESWRAHQLLEQASYMRQTLNDLDMNICRSQTHIIPLLCGSEQHTIWLRQQLKKQGVYGSVFCAPATPKNKSLIRLSINCSHSKAQLQKVAIILNTLKTIKPELNVFST